MLFAVTTILMLSNPMALTSRFASHVYCLTNRLTPKDVEPSKARDWDWRRLRVGICNVDEMTNRKIRKSYDFCLLDKLVSKVKDQNNGNVDIGGNESFRIPMFVNKDSISTG